MSNKVVVRENPHFVFEDDFTIKDLNLFNFYNLSNRYGDFFTQFDIRPMVPNSTSTATVSMDPTSLNVSSYTKRMFSVEINQNEKLSYLQLAMAEAIFKINFYYKELKKDDSLLPHLTERLAEVTSTETQYRAYTKSCLKAVKELNSKENIKRPLIVNINEKNQITYHEFNEKDLDMEAMAKLVDKALFNNVTYVYNNKFIVRKTGIDRIDSVQGQAE